jgi:hypothetical protein
MKNNENIFIYAALVIVAILMVIGFMPMKCHAQTIDMSFGQVTNMNVYRMKIQVSEDITWKWLTVTPYGGFDSYASWTGYNIMNGSPFRDTYSMGIKTTIYDNWSIDFSHQCTHDVINSHYPDGSVYPDSKWKGHTWDSNLTIITVGYKKKFSSWEIGN